MARFSETRGANHVLAELEAAHSIAAQKFREDRFDVVKEMTACRGAWQNFVAVRTAGKEHPPNLVEVGRQWGALSEAERSTFRNMSPISRTVQRSGLLRRGDRPSFRCDSERVRAVLQC